MTERKPRPVTPERPTPAPPPERESLNGRVILEAEWLNPGLGRTGERRKGER